MIDEAAAWARLDALAKPPRSLGELEALAVRLAVVQQRIDPVTRPRALTLFAGDHGVVAQGVSAWPSAVTGLMMATILAGQASSAVLAAAHGCTLRLVDVGAVTPPPQPWPDHYRSVPVAAGTADLSQGAAMTAAQFEAAWTAGGAEAALAVGLGNAVLITGEMGIGNTTPAACLTSLLAGASTDIAVGRGAGADDAAMVIKRRIVGEAVDRARPRLADDPRGAISAVAGFEIVAMAGFFAAGAAAGATLLLDGYVATAAALVAERLAPGTARRMIAAHRSAEPGHGAALAHLGLEPVLDWQMRLGEGTGALVALPLLDSAAAVIRDVALLADVLAPQ
ncbi:nicotinate-nucleotide--dimethylbenzimidazole phosphoribosyltransferase [Polymorphobacter fuscus]|uniref:Nicotinate-nucleotide--dimethylbenzimidazole phosphoribosyltransferase n=1 Tax=Sandarakinorhabdus fusca TaxID=1439888 RepID=A0A7C9GNM2_9SPHN|nr:nicotinate-nucleotide--dimethylbenzimidazole phosphoribosyltransferase [Polymorphobacter fuscus]KAB7648547.1 nicotinate-nucleotide--dimethylbenzimidazole phosphoribosyltransferase [Polymorphobacter fuscus]MQT16090.1 nicotinate-nucleotide--dimethylbenzimidazole phosphoribosyltransferase [Polymorphobacter fuscus]NJC07631.1 nicotinate-nucleotide--dimethylbenzimidazole phosphoribosyltransferase [Polymorphobacter fuscus]